MINAMKKHLEELKYQKPNTVSKLHDVSAARTRMSALRADESTPSLHSKSSASKHLETQTPMRKQCWLRIDSGGWIPAPAWRQRARERHAAMQQPTWCLREGLQLPHL